MKYKVLVQIDNTGGSNPDALASFSFYTFNAAHECATAWAALFSSTLAFMWDGTTWRMYQ
jgi:hypothetical protein